MIDFSKFKKVKEDKDSATLKHDDGHTISISKKALNKKTASMLKGLPMYAEGGEVEPQLPNLPDTRPQHRQTSLAEDLGLGRFAADDDFNFSKGKEQAAPAPMPTEAATPAAPQGQPSAPENYPISAARSPAGPNIQQTMDAGMAAGLAGGFNQQAAGIQAEAKAQGELGKQEAAAADRHAEMVQKVMADHEKHYQALNQEITNTVHDIENKHIDPGHYMASKSTFGKVSTAIGLILGGMGGGMTGQENQALKFLNSQIDRDIESQKAEIGKKESILNAYFKQTGDMRAATELTKAFYTDLYANEITKAAAKAKSPIAMARAQQAAGQLNVQKAQVLQPLALRSAMMSGVKAGHVSPEQVVQFVVPEHERKDRFEDLKDMQNISAARDDALEAFDKIAAMNSAGNRLLSPLQMSRQIAALKEPIVAKLSKATAGRFTEQDSKMLDHLLSEMGDSHETKATRRQALANLFVDKLHFPGLKVWGIEAPPPRAMPNRNGYAKR